VASNKRLLISLTMVLWVWTCRSAGAYSILGHEAMVDAVWNDSIVPVMRHRFPRITPQELMTARAYAYGGSVIQDLG